MREALYQNSKSCEPKGFSPEAVRQYYWYQGFNAAEEKFNSTLRQPTEQMVGAEPPQIKPVCWCCNLVQNCCFVNCSPECIAKFMAA